MSNQSITAVRPIDFSGFGQLKMFSYPVKLTMAQPVQSTQEQQPPSFEGLWGIFLEQLGIVIEKEWAKVSPNSYMAFKVGQKLNSSSELPSWMRDAGGLLVIAAIIVGLDDSQRAKTPRRLGLN